MGNKITTTGIVDPSIQQPWLGPSLEFLQNANKDLVVGICRSIMGETNYALSTTRGVCMGGCSFAGGGNTMFLGYIFFNGELYYTGGVSGLNSFINVPVAILSDISDTTIDPITMSDGSNQFVHRKRSITFADQNSGSGLFNLTDMIMLPKGLVAYVPISTFITTSGPEQDVTGATYTTPTTTAAAPGITKNYKVTFIGDNFGTGAITTVTGSVYKLKSGASIIMAKNVFGITGDGTTACRLPIVIVCYLTSVAPGTILKITSTRNTSNNQSVENGIFMVEETN